MTESFHSFDASLNLGHVEHLLLLEVHGASVYFVWDNQIKQMGEFSMNKQSLDFIKQTLEGLKQRTASVLEEGLIEHVILMLDREYPAYLLEEAKLDIDASMNEHSARTLTSHGGNR
ncbi:hypothetical protein [Paenibacillus sp. MMO-58]|uniref:hypothetical protein n=1 Tax=Paenibacillus sp. MMO-58 TaxID=3081290 RepID=UPI003015DA55